MRTNWEMIEETTSKETFLNYVTTEGDIYILGEFDDSISKNVIPFFAKRIDELSGAKDPYINIYINSAGGQCKQLYAMLTMVELAKSRGIRINTINLGIAYSCGSILAIVGDHRSMYKYARNLMHLGQQFGDSTTFKQIERNTKKQLEHFDNIVELYKEHTKMTEKTIRKELEDDDFILNAEECLKYGFVDEIIGGGIMEEPMILEVTDGDKLLVGNRELVIKVKEPKKVKKSVVKSKTKEQKVEGE